MEKIILNVKPVPAFGHIISDEGIVPDPSKLEPMINARAPEDVKGVQRLLGMVNYYQDYLQNFATMTEPLRRLTRKGVRFDWDKECQQSFQAIKDSLQESSTAHL